MAVTNGTGSVSLPNLETAQQLPPWVEPVVVISILLLSMVATRRRNYPILLGSISLPSPSGLDDDSSDHGNHFPSELSHDNSSTEDLVSLSGELGKHGSKRRRCCGLIIATPNTSRYAKHFHSRVLQKFPFLIEMFYWVINYGFYRITRIFAQEIFSRRGVWNVAQSHALSVLELEQFGWMSRIVPATELEVQQWFLEYHPTALLFLNRVYALMHIPSTVGFIAWYYYVSPTFTSFAIARRTMALTNFLAFTIFTLYPCMPPRLLPPEYGFVDTVRHDNAQSVWMRGDYVNSLAAMPSMHFGYSLVLGATVVYHFGLSRDAVTNGGASSLRWLRAVCLMLGLMYPALILITIVATANHYWLDAIAAFGVVCLAFVFNRVLLCLLPVEDVLLWLLRLEKPTPTTGERFRRAKGWRLGFQGERV